MPNRRDLLKGMLLTTAAAAIRAYAQTPVPLPPWTRGLFDIHHIDTGRGNATLLIFPDGTTMLIDAGAVASAPAGTLNPARPNGTTLRPGQVVAQYIQTHIPSPAQLDYFVATHLHNDHIAGLADVLDAAPIGTFIDRGYPQYAKKQQPPSSTETDRYLDILRKQQAAGHTVEAADVGSTTQIRLQRTSVSQSQGFGARVLAANGYVWNPGSGNVEAHLAALPAATDAHGFENLFSVALLFTYGRFRYFTGGDLTCDTEDGRHPEFDIETPVVHSAGPVDVAVADHHGYFDACGPAFSDTLDAQAYVIPSWDIGHPGSAQMQRLTGIWNSTGSHATHDVFALELLPANALLNRRFAPQLRSQSGHVVVRVAPGGDTFHIHVLDSTVPNGAVLSSFGPYTSRSGKGNA